MKVNEKDYKNGFIPVHKELLVYNPATRRNESVIVTEEVYNVYRRTCWNIEDNNESFYDHEIQMSSLIGGEDGAYENFREFVDIDNTPENFVEQKMMLELLRNALSYLTESESELIRSLFFTNKTERCYAIENSIPPMTVHDRKVRALNKLKKFMRIEK